MAGPFTPRLKVILRENSKTKNEIDLKVVGLMVIPPNDNNTEKYFKSMNELNKSLALENLSMGMSADYTLSLIHI